MPGASARGGSLPWQCLGCGRDCDGGSSNSRLYAYVCCAHCNAASPTVPFGDQFQTRVVVSLEDAGGDVRLRARSNVHWLRSKRPMGMISSRVEKAAEKGAAEAYAVLARCLMDGGGASEAGFASLVASKARPHRKKIVSCAVLGSLVAFLQYHADDAPPDDPSGAND